MSENPEEIERVDATEQSNSDLGADSSSATSPAHVNGLGQDGAHERPHEEEAKQSAPKRRGRKPKGTTNHDVTDTKHAKKDKVTNCTTEKSKSNEATLDADLVGMRKITSYFPTVSRDKVLLSLNKYCFDDCLHDRADEEAGPMLSCDFCGGWFHLSCCGLDFEDAEDITVWFCRNCRTNGKEMKTLKNEVQELREQITHLKEILEDRPNMKPRVTDKPKEEVATITSAKASGKQTTNDDKDRIIEQLRKQNSDQQEGLQSMQEFVQQLLDEKETDSQKWIPVTRRKQPNNKKSANTNQTKSKPHDDNRNSQSTLVIGDSHIKRLDNTKMPGVKACGIGGLKSNEVMRRHANTLKDNLPKSKEVILHVGSNDVKAKSPQQILSNIDHVTKEIKEINPNASITISSTFLRKDDTTLNCKIVESNSLLKKFCRSHGHNFLDHSNISFRHLCNDGLHLNPAGIELFTRNILNHVQSG